MELAKWRIHQKESAKQKMNGISMGAGKMKTIRLEQGVLNEL
jgi:hypothetical protein